MKIRKEILQNENVIVAYNLLEMIYNSNYRTTMPKHLLDKIKETYDLFYKEISKEYISSENIDRDDLIERIEFEGNNLTYTYPKGKISLYDLLNMYKDGIPLPDRVRLYLLNDKEIYEIYKDNVDDSFIGYVIADTKRINESKGFMMFLSDCLNQRSFFDNCIEIISTKR